MEISKSENCDIYNYLVLAKQQNKQATEEIIKYFDSFINYTMKNYNIIDKDNCKSEIYITIFKCIRVFKI